MPEKSITMTIQRLSEIVEMAKNNASHHDQKGLLVIEINQLPSGFPELSIYQPSAYPDAAGTTFLIRS